MGVSACGVSERDPSEINCATKVRCVMRFRWLFKLPVLMSDPCSRQLRTARKPEREIRAYEEYMLAAQAALRQPPTEAKPQVDSLETRIRQLGEPEQNM